MQGGKQNANETKRDGKANPCRRMDVQKPRGFTQELHTSDKTWKSYHTFSPRQGLKQKTENSIKKQAGLK
jgi:hypothetical protein